MPKKKVQSMSFRGAAASAIFKGMMAASKESTATEERIPDTCSAPEEQRELSHWKERAVRAETRLGIAGTALYKLSRLGNGNIPGNSEGNVIAQEAIIAIESIP